MSVEIKVEDTDWEYAHELGLVEDDLRLIADRLRADETKKMVNAVEVSRPTLKCVKLTSGSVR